jgi:phospholipase/lecithinase/hemolysin
MRFARMTAILALMILSVASRSDAGYFSQIVAFGDSLSDTGNVYTSAGNTFPASPPYFNGRFSNGPVWLETLAKGLGVADPAPALLGGTDYAFGGAETGLSGRSIQNTPNIGTQVALFLGSNPTITANELFTVWGGANDFLHFPTLALPDPATPVANLIAEITALAQAGGRNFLVPNLPMLGETPYVKNELAPLYPGIEATMNDLSLQFDSELAAALNGLQAKLGITIYQLDVNSVFRKILANPGDYGIADVSDQAKSGATGLPGTVVSDPNSYLFWDDVHPTAPIHQLIGQQALDLVSLSVPEPSSIILVGLGIAGGAIHFRGRRKE